MGRRKLESITDYERALRNSFGRESGEDYLPFFRTQDYSLLLFLLVCEMFKIPLCYS